MSDDITIVKAPESGKLKATALRGELIAEVELPDDFESWSKSMVKRHLRLVSKLLKHELKLAASDYEPKSELDLMRLKRAEEKRQRKWSVA